jgi:hypothetical protein
MSIERDEQIRFHELGTLTSVTRWIRSHDEGVAEWLKNARRAYQPDRANGVRAWKGPDCVTDPVAQPAECPLSGPPS